MEESSGSQPRLDGIIRINTVPELNRIEQRKALSSAATPFDLAIVGGGATGLGIALDAALRGYSVLLTERGDFASGTSSVSTKLIHGGVRYLKQGNLRLVQEALQERGRLENNAPGMVRRQAFVIPVYRWQDGPFYAAGLKFYDALAGTWSFGPSRWLSREETVQHLPGITTLDLRGGVLYWDGQFDDARLAIQLAKSAAREGAILLNHANCVDYLRQSGTICGVRIYDKVNQETLDIPARVTINATGVEVDSMRRLVDSAKPPLISASQGAHLVLPQAVLPGSSALMLPATDDGRVLFAIPWMARIILGTTDTPVREISPQPQARAEELSYLLDHVSRYLVTRPGLDDICSTFAGLRPLFRKTNVSTARLSREHVIEHTHPGLFSVAGGKWTTYRKMAEDTLSRVESEQDWKPRTCRTRNWPLLPLPHQLDLVNSAATSPENGLPTELIRYFMSEEMAETVEDILARRTRWLLLDAGQAMRMAPSVVREMRRINGRDDNWEQQQLSDFGKVAERHLPAGQRRFFFLA